MLHVLPIDASEPAYTVDVALSGAMYRFAVAWNTREEAWSLGLLTAAGEPIQTGVRIVADYPLFASGNDPRLPPGRILVTDLSGRGQDPTRENLGTDVVVIYDDGLD